MAAQGRGGVGPQDAQSFIPPGAWDTVSSRSAKANPSEAHPNQGGIQMIGGGREGFPEAFCPSLGDRHRPAHCHYTELRGRPRTPGKQGRPDIKYVINRMLRQVNTVRTGGLHIPHVCQGPGPWPWSQRCCWPLRCCCPRLRLTGSQGADWNAQQSKVPRSPGTSVWRFMAALSCFCSSGIWHGRL